MDEKRKLERFDLQVPVKIEVVKRDREKGMLDLLTSNICSGGAFLHTNQPLPKGTEVKIDLVLPIDKLRKIEKGVHQVYIKVKGTVQRTESAGMAISFDEDYQIGPWQGK
jgi:hypothetical protein